MLEKAEDLKKLSKQQYKIIFPLIAKDISLGIEKVENEQKKIIEELLLLGCSGEEIFNIKKESNNIFLQNKKLKLLKKEKYEI